MIDKLITTLLTYLARNKLRTWLDALPLNGFKTYILVVMCLLAEVAQTHTDQELRAMAQQIYSFLLEVGYSPSTVAGTFMVLAAVAALHKGMKFIDWLLQKFGK